MREKNAAAAVAAAAASESVAVAVSRANARLSVTERVRKHALVEPFTVENGMMTPTQKIRRLAVATANRELLQRLHG